MKINWFFFIPTQLSTYYSYYKNTEHLKKCVMKPFDFDSISIIFFRASILLPVNAKNSFKIQFLYFFLSYGVSIFLLNREESSFLGSKKNSS